MAKQGTPFAQAIHLNITNLKVYTNSEIQTYKI